MNSNGTIRELQLFEQPKPDEILIPPADVDEVRSWPRARRRAWYRDQAKKLQKAGTQS
jgi:hypothetical protein